MFSEGAKGIEELGAYRTCWHMELINHLKETMKRNIDIKVTIRKGPGRENILKAKGKLILLFLYSNRTLS